MDRGRGAGPYPVPETVNLLAPRLSRRVLKKRVQRRSNAQIEEKRGIAVDPVLSRTCVREFGSEPVSPEMVKTLLEAAMAAPSVADERPWHFIVIRDPAIKRQILKVHRFAHLAPQASAAVLVCGDKKRQKQRGFWVQDCAAATENILIEAQQLGLGAVWLAVYPIEGLVQGFRRLLGIAEHVVPFGLVLVGHPAKQKEPVNRYDESRVHTDGWNDSPSNLVRESRTK